jgi:hypothetical protein
MNKEYEILPIIKDQCSRHLGEFDGFVYDDLSKSIIQWGGKIENEVRRIYTVPENKNIPVLRKRRFIKGDELEEIEESNNQQTDEHELPSDDELWSINNEVVQVLRLLEFSGNLLKNYSGELNNRCREEIISIMVNSLTKVIGAFCKFSMLAVNKIIDMVLEKIKTGDEPDIDAQNEFTQFIKKLFADIWMEYVRLCLRRLAGFLECDLLRKNIDDYVDNNTCDFTRMIRLEFILRTTQNLPVKDINILFKGKNRLGSISQDIMKGNIYRYLSNYQYNLVDKQSVCSTLGFSIKDVLIEEKKNSEMNKL